MQYFQHIVPDNIDSHFTCATIDPIVKKTINLSRDKLAASNKTSDNTFLYIHYNTLKSLITPTHASTKYKLQV